MLKVAGSRLREQAHTYVKLKWGLGSGVVAAGLKGGVIRDETAKVSCRCDMEPSGSRLEMVARA